MTICVNCKYYKKEKSVYEGRLIDVCTTRPKVDVVNGDETNRWCSEKNNGACGDFEGKAK